MLRSKVDHPRKASKALWKEVWEQAVLSARKAPEGCKPVSTPQHEHLFSQPFIERTGLAAVTGF